MEQAIETVDLRYYLSILHKWRFAIALVTIIAVIVSGVFSFFILPPVYETKVTLMVSQASIQRATQSQPDDLSAMVGIVSRLPEMTINTYVGQLSSPYFLDRVARELGLDPELYTPVDMAKFIDVRAIKDTNLIEVKVSNNSAKLATEIANKISTEFIDFITETLQDQMGRSLMFLREQATQAERDLAAANEQLRQVQVGLRGVEFLSRELMSKSAVLSEHESSLMKIRVEEASIAAGLDSITQQLSVVSPFVKSRESGQIPGQEWNPVYRQMEQQLHDKRVELAEKQQAIDQGGMPGADLAVLRLEADMLRAGIQMLENLLAATPMYVNLQSGTETSEMIINPLWQSLMMQQTDRSVDLAQKQALRLGYEASVKQLTNEITELQSQLAEKRTEEYRLVKQVDQLEHAFSLLSEKIIQTEMAQSMNIGEANISVVAPAIQPRLPVRPRKGLNMAVALILGLMASVAMAFVLEYTDYTIKSAEDVARHLGVPALGSVPVISQQRSNGRKGGS